MLLKACKILVQYDGLPSEHYIWEPEMKKDDIQRSQTLTLAATPELRVSLTMRD